jgi:hypothetical protein
MTMYSFLYTASYMQIKQHNAQFEDVFLLSESISEYPMLIY